MNSPVRKASAVGIMRIFLSRTSAIVLTARRPAAAISRMSTRTTPLFLYSQPQSMIKKVNCQATSHKKPDRDKRTVPAPSCRIARVCGRFFYVPCGAALALVEIRYF